MDIEVNSPATLGLLVRAVRRSAKVRLDDLASTAGVSKQFLSDVERGKPTVQLGLVLKLLHELGVALQADIPSAALDEFNTLVASGGVRGPKRRRDEPPLSPGSR